MKGKQWENVNLKILSLLMAVLLEVYFFSPDNSVSTALSATLEMNNVPADMMIVSPERSEHGIPIRIDVRGPRPLIEQINGSMYRFAVSYPAEHPRQFRPTIDLKQLSLPVGVEVIGITPSDLKLEFEPILAKELPVFVEETGKPRPGFVLNLLRATPPSVRVTGPERDVNVLEEVRSEKVSVEDLTESRDFEPRLLSPKSRLRFSPTTVNVHAEIVPLAGQASFEPVNVKLLAPRGYAGTVEPSRVKVVLAGPPALLSSLTVSRLELKADARSLDEGRFQIRLRGDLPQGVSILSTDPELVSVQLMRQEGS